MISFFVKRNLIFFLTTASGLEISRVVYCHNGGDAILKLLLN